LHWHNYEYNHIHLIAALIGYFYFSFALYVIADRTKTDGAILAFIPLLDLIPLIGSSRRSWLWLLALLVPLLNIFAFAWIWMGIAEARKKEPLLGILMLIPVVNVFVLGYLAFVD